VPAAVGDAALVAGKSRSRLSRASASRSASVSNFCGVSPSAGTLWARVRAGISARAPASSVKASCVVAAAPEASW
jgi:hypothetical protein